MTDITHRIHLFIQETADKHGVTYDLDTESRKMLINFVKTVQFLGDQGTEMVILAFLVGYDSGAKNHYLRQGT